jgi:MoaA/NifB/PqqE/SkfB family radical SAM enzyme
MALETFEIAARELFPTAYRVFLSGGGESLTNKHFDKMLELCLHYEVHPVVYTNGTLLNSKRVALLVESGAYLGISIDGATRETFEKLRFPARWRRIVKSLELVRKLRADVGNEDFFPYLQVVVQKDNIKELDRFVDLAGEFGIEQIKFSNIYPHFPALEEKVPDPQEASLQFVRVFEKANKRGIRLEVPDYGLTEFSERMSSLREANNAFPIALDRSEAGRYFSGGFVKYPDFRSGTCMIPWSETMITPEGKVVVGCCSQYQLGDLNEQPFKSIWNGERYRELRKTVNTEEPMPFCVPHDVCPFRK